MYSNDVKSITTSNNYIDDGLQEYHNSLRYNPLSGMYEYDDDEKSEEKKQ